MNNPVAQPVVLDRTAFTASAGLSTDPVPLDPYRTREFFELERDRIFRRAWLMMGRVEEVPNPGDYVLRRIDPCKVSALITRGQDGKLRAFHNSCSHRGSELVSEAQGNRKRFVCPYHAWAYGSDGALQNIPDEMSFFGVDKAKCGLAPIALEVWEGWYFLNLQPKPEVSLQQYLGPLADYLKGLPYIAASNPLIIQADLDANWKVVVDAFLESSHIPVIHPKTIGSTFSSRENPFARILDAKMLGPHRALSMYGNPSLQLNPNNKVEMLAYASAATGNVISAASMAEMQSFLAHPSVNPTGTQSWSMDVNQVFPHAHIDCGPGGFWYHQFWPVTPNTCRYEVRFYVPEAADARQRLQQELYVARVMEIVLEDLSNVARTQRGIDSGGKSHMQLQDSEVGIRHHMHHLLKWTSASTVAEALAE